MQKPLGVYRALLVNGGQENVAESLCGWKNNLKRSKLRSIAFFSCANVDILWDIINVKEIMLTSAIQKILTVHGVKYR